MDEVRMAKFETLIEDIDSLIRKRNEDSRKGVDSDLSSLWRESIDTNENIQTPLFMIFTPDKLNEYALTICKRASFALDSNTHTYGKYESISDDIFIVSKNPHNNLCNVKDRGKSFEDDMRSIEAAMDFVKCCRKNENRPEAYKFIFWSLMILTVEDEGSDEWLSLICDFAHMLRIIDSEIIDIIFVIKCIYSEVKKEYSFKSEVVPSIFGDLLNKYRRVILL